ncbi:MAG TPA: hypothetical protein P5555_00090 [Candidatus Paceibacterota bacterium]|nr:hypothetical protein [Verrucomicrobiota bacterium]HOX00904.1 hypothetical protein [Verrucomicrobiota bacterium]HRZ43571.1 hypothetical protein [Candidatus Paceibacterota bacterium]HRZ93553.1 hypothetical protein [Candidatus Paceibacterota bacterium]
MRLASLRNAPSPTRRARPAGAAADPGAIGSRIPVRPWRAVLAVASLAAASLSAASPLNAPLLKPAVTLSAADRGAKWQTEEPFLQETAVRFEHASELAGARYLRLAISRDGIAYVLTDRGVARLFGQTLAMDHSFRPLSSIPTLDLAVHDGEVFYLLEDRFLSNGRAGLDLIRLPASRWKRAAWHSSNGCAVWNELDLGIIPGDGGSPALLRAPAPVRQVIRGGSGWWVLTDTEILQTDGRSLSSFHSGRDLTAIASSPNALLAGTRHGYYAIDPLTGRQLAPRQTRLPVLHITCLAPRRDGLWAGTTGGVFRQRPDGAIDYYASRRWLPDDSVVDLGFHPDGTVMVLTGAGLGAIAFRPLTLEQKAAHYQDKIRQRHVRYGFCAELRLERPGDPASARMIDTDNDGTWTQYYLASQAFRYGATGDESAHRHAWDAFAALERLESIHTLEGFPARSFERAGFATADPERWHPVGDGQWDWKSHTSSDEIAAHTFGCAVLYETAARTPSEKARIARFYTRIVDHILRHDLYLVDVDGQPTLWGRWNPEYVNHYPPAVFDRRLNSSEIIASLQLAEHFTGDPKYRQKAFELFERHGYLDNISLPMRGIQFTPVTFRGIVMGDEWNHSDDLLAFVTYWVLHRFAFTGELRARYAAAIRDHWNIERIERNPLWNFVYASTGAAEFGLEDALETLRQYPLELIDWAVANSDRPDIDLLAPSFRGQQSAQWLPPDERRIMRWNGNPFVLDGGSGGRQELAGDEFLLPYWMGRYLGIIRPPQAP